MNLLDEGHHLFNEFERGVHQLHALVAQHTFKEILMENLDDLIAAGHKLKAERADLVKDRDAWKDQAHSEHIRADMAEAALKALEDQTTADEAKLKAALDEMSAEVETEAPNAPTTVTVSAPTVAPTTTIPVSTDQPIAVGTPVSGPGIAEGSTVVASDASSVTVSQPTTADHAGDGSETLTVSVPAADTAPTAG